LAGGTALAVVAVVALAVAVVAVRGAGVAFGGEKSEDQSPTSHPSASSLPAEPADTALGAATVALRVAVVGGVVAFFSPKRMAPSRAGLPAALTSPSAGVSPDDTDAGECAGGDLRAALAAAGTAEAFAALMAAGLATGLGAQSSWSDHPSASSLSLSWLPVAGPLSAAAVVAGCDAVWAGGPDCSLAWEREASAVVAAAVAEPLADSAPIELVLRSCE
jgi:hypothetical protein